jgi:hypothetical protein
MSKKVLSLFFSVILFVSFAHAQTAEVTLQLNEPFFDALLDAVFTNLKEPDFDLSRSSGCEEKVTLLREMDGVRTAVRFRDGKIYAPLAFRGKYNPPLIGCTDFSGWAETNITLEFDRDKQLLLARVKVTNVQLGSVANLAGGIFARFIQSSIDKKVNPIEIMKTDKFDFIVPIQQAQGALRVKANNIRYEVGDKVINVIFGLEFLKADSQ